jgi:hypothetical protein
MIEFKKNNKNCYVVKKANFYHVYEGDFLVCSLKTNIATCEVMVMRAWCDDAVWNAALLNKDYELE